MTVTTTALRPYCGFSHRELDFIERRLEAQVASLKGPTTTMGAALLQQYMDRLDQVRAERERRAC